MVDIDKWVILCWHHRTPVFICDSTEFIRFTFFSSFWKIWEGNIFKWEKYAGEKTPIEINEFYVVKIFYGIFLHILLCILFRWNCISSFSSEKCFSREFWRHSRWLQNQFNEVLISCYKLNFRSFLLIEIKKQRDD